MRLYSSCFSQVTGPMRLHGTGIEIANGGHIVQLSQQFLEGKTDGELNDALQFYGCPDGRPSMVMLDVEYRLGTGGNPTLEDYIDLRESHELQAFILASAQRVRALRPAAKVGAYFYCFREPWGRALTFEDATRWQNARRAEQERNNGLVTVLRGLDFFVQSAYREGSIQNPSLFSYALRDMEISRECSRLSARAAGTPYLLAVSPFRLSRTGVGIPFEEDAIFIPLACTRAAAGCEGAVLWGYAKDAQEEAFLRGAMDRVDMLHLVMRTARVLTTLG